MDYKQVPTVSDTNPSGETADNSDVVPLVNDGDVLVIESTHPESAQQVEREEAPALSSGVKILSASQKIRKRIKKAVPFVLTASLVAAGSGHLLYEYERERLPSVDTAEQAVKSVQFKIQKTDPHVMPERPIEVIGGIPLSTDEIPDYVRDALTVREDKRFFEHGGVDFFGIARACARNITSPFSLQGGSTLTQQLAKNLYLNLDTSIRRKIDEIILAFKLEEQYSKDEILTMYLNVVPFGKGTHGIEEASLYYLGKHAKDLSVYEAALLIGSLKAPETQNFIDDPDTAHSRARAILSAMEEVGTIEDADKLDRAVRKGGLENSTMNEAMLYGALRGEAEKLLDGQTGDFTIVSTVDPGLQRHSEDELEEGVQRIRRGNRSSQGPTGAVVVMGPGGEILASVGTHDWKEYQYDNSRMAHRQPGSAIKPFVFAAAFKQNADLRPQTLVPASKMTFDGGFRPQNADGLYPEQIPLEDALAHSRNTTAVWLLDTKVGLNDFYDFSRRFGLYDSPNEKPFDNLSVALGSREVTPLELTNAYTAFAQQGVQYEPHMVRFVRDGRGNIEQAKYDPVRVLSESVAIQVNGMLRRVVTHGTGKENVYDPDIPLAGKTGTTNENRDAWFAGYQFGVKNPVTAAVWIGRPNGNGSSGTTGHGMPAHIFHEIMEGVGHDYSAPQREAVSISEVIPAPEKPPESESNPTDSSTESKNETPSKVADWIRSIREKLASTKMPDVFASESTEEVDKFNRQEAELVQKAEQSGNDMDYYRLADFYFDHGKNRKAKKALANIEHLTSIASQITSLSPEMARYLVRKIEYGFPLTRLMDFSSETAGELAKHKDILRIGGVRNAEARSILENNFQGTQLFIGGVQAN